MTQKDFEKFVHESKNRLYRYALSYMHDQERAEDVIQDIYLKLWEKIKRNESLENPEAWCIRCVRNRSLDILKSKSSKMSDLENVQELEARDDISSQTETRDIIMRVREIVELLPEKQQEIFRLREFMQYSNKEIEKLLDLTATDVKVNLYRARIRIREILQKTMDYGVR